MLEKLMDSPIVWLVLALLAIFSTCFAIYTWIAGKKRKQFSFACITNEMIIAGKNKIDKLQIKYDGRDIQDLSVSKFFVWNCGNTVIDSADIVSSKPLCIRNTGNAKILDVHIISVNEETNAFTIANIEEEYVELAFDYVNHGEGVVLQVLHTGASKDLVIDCKIKGGSEVVDRSPIKSKHKIAKSQVFFEIVEELLPTMLSFLLVLISVIPMSIIDSIYPDNEWLIKVLTVFCGIGAFTLGTFLAVKIPKLIKQRLHRSIPDTLLK